MDQVPLLIATAGPLKGQRYQVTEDGLLLGREDTCDVIIPDTSVSREHARLLFKTSCLGNKFTAGLDADYARFLQETAHAALR